MRLRCLLALLLVAVATQASAQQEVRIKGCEYAVTFPTPPRAVSYQAGGKPGEFFVTQTEDGPPILRAECQRITDRSGLSEALIVKSLEEQAASIGLSNVQVTMEHSQLGLVGTYVGRKTASGHEMIQMGKLYVGRTSVLNLLVIETLKAFPSKRANAFLWSVKR
jgi:hypothetical protein